MYLLVITKSKYKENCSYNKTLINIYNFFKLLNYYYINIIYFILEIFLP